MRTALRTAITTALVAGVALTAPALTAGAAFAADGPVAAPAATTAPAPAPAATTSTPAPAATATTPTPDVTPDAPPVRTVQLVGGLSARVYARGDQHPYYTATVLKGGKELGELKAGGGYRLKDTEVFAGYAVTLDFEGGVSAVQDRGSNGQGEPAPVDEDTLGACTVARTVSIGAGMGAKLIMSPAGPKARIVTAGDDRVVATLDRSHPSLPASAGYIARIVGAYSATPSLYTKVEGGTSTGGSQAFPKLPKGCELDPVESGTSHTGTNNGTNTGTGGSTGTHGGGQTSVVPKGGVAAGAEIAEANDTALYASAAGAAAVVAGLGLLTPRRRAAGAKG